MTQLKRPIRIYDDGGQLYIKNNKGKKIYIKTTLTKSKVQKQFIKQYELSKVNKLKRDRRRKKIATRIYTKVPVVNRSEDSKSSSTIGIPVVAESKQPTNNKDSIYMSTGERDDALIKQITYNRIQNLIKTGIIPTAVSAGDTEDKLKELQLKQDVLAKYVRDKAIQIEDKLSKPTGSTTIKQRQNREQVIKGISPSPEEQARYRALNPSQKIKMKEDYKLEQEQIGTEAKGIPTVPIEGKGTTPSSIYPDESLYEDQITEIIQKHDGVFCPVIAHDEMEKIILNKTKPTFFIMNLSNRKSPSGGTHWTAVWIDKKDCCYFDSFGREPDKQTKQELTTLLDGNNLNTLRKFKYNTNEIQDINSSDCGFMSIKFIENMLHGKSFKEATDYTEADVQKMVKKYASEYL